MKLKKITDDISIVLSGEAGRGLQTIEQLLIKTAKQSGYNVFSYSEFMSRVRGGNNSAEIRISSKRVNSFVDKIDIFVPPEVNSFSESEATTIHDRIKSF